MLVRAAQPSDARAVAGVYVRAWRQTYRGLVPDHYLDAMTVGQAERSYRHHLGNGGGICCVAEAGAGQVAGFATGGPARNPDGIYRGEIYELYLLKEYQRRGLGRRMVQTLAGRFSGMGIYTMMVWVLAQNPYRRFYERINGIYLRTGTIPFAGARLQAVAYGWISIDLVRPVA